MGKRYDKRRPQKDLLKFVIVGLLIMLLPLIYYRPNYEALQTKEIRVQSVGISSGQGRYSSQNYYLTTVSGERYEIRGDLSYTELEGALQPNTLVTIKYFRGLYIFSMTNYIKELTCDEETLVSYSGDEQLENQLVMIGVGLLIIGVGFIFYDWQTDFIRNTKNKIKRKLKRRQLDRKKNNDGT